MTARHTLGPWSLLIDEARGRPRCLIVDTEGNEIASVNPYRESLSRDAELIAAAPDLLAALQACRMHIETLERMHNHELPEGEMMRAAIAKAEL